MVLYFYFRNMQNHNDFWITVFLVAVLLQDNLLAIVNTEDATKKQTSLHEGNYCFLFRIQFLY